MKQFFAYWKTFCQYMQTPKGRHDFFDDLRALFIIASVIVLIILVLWQIEN